MKPIRVIGSLALALWVGTASASITFDNVTIAGTLADGATFAVNGNTIDFTLPNAAVNADGPVSIGTIAITYDVISTEPLTANELVLSGDTEIFGAAQLVVSEVIENLNPIQIIGSFSDTFDSSTILPFSETIDFSVPATVFRVKKDFTLVAVTSPTPTPTSNAVITAVTLPSIRQVLVPEPASLVSLVLAAGFLWRRRI